MVTKNQINLIRKIKVKEPGGKNFFEGKKSMTSFNLKL